MLDLLQILYLTPSQPVSDLGVSDVASGLEKQGGWYLSAVLLFITIWVVRKMLAQQKDHVTLASEAAQKHSQQLSEHTAAYMAHLEKRDEEVKELLTDTTTANVELGNSFSIIASDLRALTAEVRHQKEDKE